MCYAYIYIYICIPLLWLANLKSDQSDPTRTWYKIMDFGLALTDWGHYLVGHLGPKKHGYKHYVPMEHI